MEMLEQALNFNLPREVVFDLFYQTVIFVVGMTAVLAALGVILCTNPVYSALFLIGNMVCLALLFLLYNAEFLAAVQIVVYAGAVMILFLFIIALLGARTETPELNLQAMAGFAFVGALFCELLMTLRVDASRPIKGNVTPELIQQTGGSAKAIGIELFSQHIVPFELASILLLAAAVGIITLAKFSYRPLRKRTRV
jgi:NADH-quinone oxidoreductase subunit J